MGLIMQERSCICQAGSSWAVSYVTFLHVANKRKNPHAVALGRKGGKKGGKARWEGVSNKERSEILRRAVEARWKRQKRRRRV